MDASVSIVLDSVHHFIQNIVYILAGFLSILSAEFTARWDGRILNVHPSLIPAFCGKGFYGLKVHEAALERGVKVTGATVHLVNEIPDGGRMRHTGNAAAPGHGAGRMGAASPGCRAFERGTYKGELI